MNPMLRKSLTAAAVATLLGSTGLAVAAGTEAGTGTMDKPAATQRGTTTSPQAASSNPLYALTPSDLNGMDVVDPAGKKIGDVTDVVRSRDGNKIEAIVAAGGFLGVGDKKIAVSLDELQLVDKKLHMSATKEDLKARAEYVPEQYVKLEPKDQPISEFSAFESAPKQQPGRTDKPASERSYEAPMTR